MAILKSCEAEYPPTLGSNTETTSGCGGSRLTPDCYNIIPPSCGDFQLTTTGDDCLLSSLVEEHLNIGAANINCYKLLGIHEQGQLIDLTGNGVPISSGDRVNFPAENAFTIYTTEWRSIQKGSGVLASAFIGYDFGSIKLDNQREKYGIDTAVNHNISAIKIKQGNNSVNRATRVRLERSFDGQKWFGAAIIDLPDDSCLNTMYFRASTANRYWRLRPLAFNGGENDYWAVQAFEMIDYEYTHIKNIQDKIWLENRDRDYLETPITLKGYYDLISAESDLSRFGIELPGQRMTVRFSFNTVVALLGRPIVIGDVFELPSEAQYNTKLELVSSYFEVTDVGWSTEGYTPGWKPTIIEATIQNMYASQETADIIGGLEETTFDDGFIQEGDLKFNPDGILGEDTQTQDMGEISHVIASEAQTATPERGTDITDVQEFDDNQVKAGFEQTGSDIRRVGLTGPRHLYVEDGMPPNNLPYTEGDNFPDVPKNGDYHRLTYSKISTDIPIRLFRWSESKQRWIWLETDKRFKYNVQKPILNEFLSSKDSISAEDIK